MYNGKSNEGMNNPKEEQKQDAIYCDKPPRETQDGTHKDLTENNKKLIERYKVILDISTTEAFEILRRCHYCGSTNMEFGDAYCSERCQKHHFEYNYSCYWNQKTNNCKMCIYNEYYKNSAHSM